MKNLINNSLDRKESTAGAYLDDRFRKGDVDSQKDIVTRSGPGEGRISVCCEVIAVVVVGDFVQVVVLQRKHSQSRTKEDTSMKHSGEHGCSRRRG